MQKIVDPNDTKAVRNLENTIALYEGMINDKKAAETVPAFVADNYVQHNPLVPDGPGGLAAAFGAVTARHQNARVTPVRIIAVGDWVFAHVHFVNLNNDDPDDRGTAGVDILRFNDEGKAVEHWDVLQPIIDPAASAHGNGQL